MPPLTSSPPARRKVDWRRLAGGATYACFVGSFIGAVTQSLGSVYAGRLAERPAAGLVVVLALCLLGGSLIDTIAKASWFVVVDRAEGRLRADLLDAALAQPLPVLTEQAVGEILDRIDDDTHEVGQLLRWAVWMAARTLLASGPLWIIAGLTWWPAWVLFPLAGVMAVAVARPLLPEVSRRKVLEEMAWTDHAALVEEGIAARDDIRTSLGQAHVMRRTSELAAEVLHRLRRVLEVEIRITRRTGALLHALLAAVSVVGIALVADDRLGTGALVTLFMVTASFVGQVDMLARHLPDLQAGFGAVLRLRQMMAAPAEPEGGAPLPEGELSVEFRDLTFAYETGTFALRGVTLSVAAGHTCALVGRTGSGKSTLASLLSRAVEPDPGQVFLGGVDVLDLDLQALRAQVGVVTQRTELLAGTLADNITLFTPLPRARVAAAVEQLGLTAWVAGLPDGLDTLLGPGGTALSAGEEQLVAFARLLVRDVKVVILDEATARMDPVTEARVVAAAGKLLEGRTGLLVAHRLSTTERAEQVAVLEAGRVVQYGARAELAATPGPFRDLLAASREADPLLDGPVLDGPALDGPVLDGGLLDGGLLDGGLLDGRVPDRRSSTEAAATGADAAGLPAGMSADLSAGLSAGMSAGLPASAAPPAAVSAAAPTAPPTRDPADGHPVGTARRTTTPPASPPIAPIPTLAVTVTRALLKHPTWGVAGAVMFLVASLFGAFGAATGWLWGHLVTQLQDGRVSWWWTGLFVVALMAAPLIFSQAFWVYPRWWVSVQLGVRQRVLYGQTTQRRLARTPPGEVLARAMDADRLTRYADRWVDFINGILVVVITGLIARSWTAGVILLAVMVAAAAASALGRRVAGRSAAAASAARAGFGRSLVSALDAARTIKLAAATQAVHDHLRYVDRGRVGAAVKEHRIQALLDGVPALMVQAGVVAAWAGLVTGHWGLATTLLVANAVSGFDWFGRVAGAVVTEAPGCRAWMQATSELAGGGCLTLNPPGVDVRDGSAPAPQPGVVDPLRTLEVRGLTAVHDDGTVGVSDVDLSLSAGDLVLLLGRVGSGKSSLLGALAGLTTSTGAIRWNGHDLTDHERDLRPGRVATVMQVPRVLSGTFADNITLDHPARGSTPALATAIDTARLARDVAEAGGPEAVVGHRGVRLSGGQVQRLALARALACHAELLLADDVSSALDAATEVELWQGLRASGTTVLGATSKAAALAQADQVLVLKDGAIVARGTWRELAPTWSHLAG